MRTHQQNGVESHESCRVKSLDAARFILVSLTPVIGHDGCYFAFGNECGKASHCEHRHRDYITSVWVKFAQEMG
jgi:hypothetical protein